MRGEYWVNIETISSSYMAKNSFAKLRCLGCFFTLHQCMGTTKIDEEVSKKFVNKAHNYRNQWRNTNLSHDKKNWFYKVFF